MLVGAGPGDPGLLTLKALRALNEADVIMYDRLVSDDIMALARRDATRVSWASSPAKTITPPRPASTRCWSSTRAGRRVVRLKGGDAFIFGRGGEELEYLREHGVRYEVVPGITAALACAAYAGIPLTHREHAQSVRLVTAHCRDDEDNLDWPALAREADAGVLHGRGPAGRAQPPADFARRAPDTPFALIENGSRPEQRVLSGAVKDLPDLARAHGIRSPALLIVGEVAGLASRLQWFGRHIDGGQGDGQPQRLAA